VHSRRSKSRLLFLALLLGWPVSALAAPTAVKLVDALGDAGDSFGASVALDGSYAIVGAPGDATAGPGAGKAVIYFDGGSGWVEQASLYPTVSPGFARFGASVSISGSYAVVGSPYLAGGYGEGRVYVFERMGSTWSLHAVLTGPGSSLDDRFGAAVAIDGIQLLVGAPGYDGGQTDSGAVHAFERSGASWSHVNRVDDPHPATQQWFGRSLDLDLPWAVVGSQPRAGQLGWVYVLDRPVSPWTVYTQLRPGDATLGDDLGASVAVSSGRLMASAPGHTGDSNLATGASFVFEVTLGLWSQTKEFVLLPGNAESMAVGIDGDLALMSKDNGLLYPGVTLASRRDPSGDWVLVAGLEPTDGLTAFGGFGSSLSASSPCVLAGAPHDTGQGTDAGAAWVFCGIPQLILAVDLDVICCKKIPDYTTAPLELAIDWTSFAADPISSQRRVVLQRPDGTQVDLVDLEQVELDPGTSLVEQFSIDLTPYVGGRVTSAEGDYALFLEWTDAEGTIQSELELFTLGLTPAIPLMPWSGALALAGALAALGLRRASRGRRAQA